MRTCTSCLLSLEPSSFYARSPACKECVKARSKLWYENNKHLIKDKKAAYLRSRKEHFNMKKREAQKRLFEANPDAFREANRKKVARRVQGNILAKLAANMRNRISAAIRASGYAKTARCAEMVGCDWEQLKAHIESGFSEGMSWSNYREWHIDHKVPLASAKTAEELTALCHYTNLQPLWAADNIRKGAKIMEAA